MSQTHKQVAAAQFGPRAQAYVASAVHSAGPDLDWLEERLRNKDVNALLDIGCGGGHVSYRLAPHARMVTACDPSEEMISMVRTVAAERNIPNIHVVCAAAETLPFEDESFDVVATRFSAHHWKISPKVCTKSTEFSSRVVNFLLLMRLHRQAYCWILICRQ